MDLGRIGLFVVIGGVSIYYGVSQSRLSMMIVGLAIAGLGILNAVVMGKRKDKDKE